MPEESEAHLRDRDLARPDALGEVRLDRRTLLHLVELEDLSCMLREHYTEGGGTRAREARTFIRGP